MFVDALNGNETEIADMPIFSPDRTHFVAASDLMWKTNKVEIWRIILNPGERAEAANAKPQRIVQEWADQSVEWRYPDVEWIDDMTFNLTRKPSVDPTDFIGQTVQYKNMGESWVGHDSSSPSTPQKITTSKGTFSVPGKAYMDGRDLSAIPPITQMEITIWDDLPRQGNTVSPRKVIYKLPHGTEVTLLKVKWNEIKQRYDFRIKSLKTQGWVSEQFVGPRQNPPTGDPPFLMRTQRIRNGIDEDEK